MGLITAAAVGIGGALISANQKNKANQAATNAQNAALDKVKPVDIADTQQQATSADIAKYKAGFDVLNQTDPGTATLRNGATAGLDKLVAGSSNSDQATSLIGTLFNENAQQSPADKAFIATLKDQAQHQLNLGGALSPEQQSEFVRAGLENSGTTGVSPGSDAAHQGVGKLLATEQMQVQQQRQSMAQQLFGFASNLDTTRVNNLSGISNLATNTDASNASKLLNISQLADSRVPSIGLGGSDIANLAIANNQTTNQVALQKGGVAASNAINKGNITSGLIGGVTGAVGGLTGSTASELLGGLKKGYGF